MRGFNKVMLMGNLGHEPELKMTPSGLALVNLRVATNHPSPKDSDAKDHVEWHRVTVFGRTAEVVGMYCHKGDTLFVEGELRTKTWIGRDEQKHFSTEIMARNVQFDMNRRADRDQDGYRSEAVA